MKAFLLTAAAVMACAGSLFAQNLPPVYTWEIGLNGGYCGITTPVGPATPYQGTRAPLVNDFSFKATYYFSEHWNISFDLGTRKWQTFGDWQINGLNGQKLNKREIRFLIADHAISESFQFNYVIPFYSQFNTDNRSNLYFGALLGLVTTINDGSQGYSTYNAPPDSSIRYMSNYNYGYGIGLSYGIQVGYTYYIAPRLGLNIELGMRHVGMDTHDQRNGSQNTRYQLLYFPETIGLRYRF